MVGIQNPIFNLGGGSMLFRKSSFGNVGSLFLFLMLSACGGGDTETRSEASVAVKSSIIELNDPDCPNGGILVETGIDENRNGILDADEVDKSEKVCNGINGVTALVRTTEESPGINCLYGGVLFEVGTDNNRNSILDTEEVSSSHYICNGITVNSDGDTPIPIGEVTYVKLLTNPISQSITVGDTANINIGLAITSYGYNADNPLVIKLSDSKGYFPTILHNVIDFSTDVSLALASRVFAEATSVSTQINIEFCQDVTCVDKVYGDKTVTVNVDASPRFTSATVLTNNITEEVIVGQSNRVNLDIDFDAEGYDYFHPLYVLINDSNINFQTQTYTLYSVSQKVTLEMQTLYLHATGVYNSTMSVSFCKDIYCVEKLQEPVTIPVSLTVRHPIISSLPTDSTLSFSQTVLESSTFQYEINLASGDDVASSFWINIYDPSGVYLKNTMIGPNLLSNTPIDVQLETYPVDDISADVRTFQIKSRVCADSSCNTVLSSVPGTTDVTLSVLYPSAELTVNETAINVTGKDGTPTFTELSGNWLVSDIGNLPAYLVTTDSSGGAIINGGVLLPKQGNFTLPLELLPQKQLGSVSTDVSFKVCLELSCDHVIGTSTSTVAVTYDINQLAGWTTHQRNAGHTGYIPITLDANNFIEGWTWTRPSSSEPIGGINPVVAQDGKVVLSYDVYFGDASVVMLDEATGNQVWETSLGYMPALNQPAISDGKVWAATTGHQDTFLHAFDFNTGSVLHSSAFSGQWPHFFAPTPYGNSIYQGGGYYGGYVHSFNTIDGQEQWSKSLGGAWDMYTPAVSGNYVFHHNGEKLNALNRKTSELEFTIDDGLNLYASHAYHGAPVVYDNIVLAYAGGAFSGRASANVEQYTERNLSAFDIESKTHLWNSTDLYLTQPAVKDGVVYIGSSSLGRLDAIDINTGDILWSWIPTDVSETQMHRNVIVTDNLLFVSTNLKVHAIDLATKQSVWTYPMPGMLSISENKTLFIATGMRESNGGLVAIKLQ